MGLPITMDQCADIMVLGDDDPPLSDGLSQQSLVARILRSLAKIGDIVAGSSHCVNSLGHNVGIGEEAHLFRGDR